MIATTAVDTEMRNRLTTMARKVLQENDLGDSTKPAPRLYPHQWLWDSCFISIGIRNYDSERASREILSLYRGQWENGMIPHEIFNSGIEYHAGPDKWQSKRMPGSPKDSDTTGVTQPPMVAEAISRICEKLSPKDRRKFLQAALPNLIRHHEWLYRERDPEDSGLVTLIHPWEAGSEDTPAWAHLMHDVAPKRVKILRRIGREKHLDRYRPDLKHMPAEVRPSTADFYTLYRLFDRVRDKHYDLTKIQEAKNIPLAKDLLFNCVLARANHILQELAKEAGIALPKALVAAMAKTPTALEELYADGAYRSRNARTGKLIDESSVGILLPLYAGTISQKRADELARDLRSKRFWPEYGVATVPTDSSYFDQRRFWQGPVWVNINWLLADGLKRYGHADLARELQLQTLQMVDTAGGMYEYFSPLDAKPVGTAAFSWTAALVLDMLATIAKK